MTDSRETRIREYERVHGRQVLARRLHNNHLKGGGFREFWNRIRGVRGKTPQSPLPPFVLPTRQHYRFDLTMPKENLIQRSSPPPSVTKRTRPISSQIVTTKKSRNPPKPPQPPQQTQSPQQQKHISVDSVDSISSMSSNSSVHSDRSVDSISSMSSVGSVDSVDPEKHACLAKFHQLLWT